MIFNFSRFQVLELYLINNVTIKTISIKLKLA